MSRMARIDHIKDLYENEDLSLREISRRTGHSFQTVQKYAYQENWSAEKLSNLEAENYPNLEKYIPSIDEWMELDRKLPRKQRHTAMRIYHRLADEQGCQGSYSSVKQYVRKKKFVLKLAAEGYLPLAQPCGHGQVDFGESLYYDAQGKERKGYALTVSFPQSNKGYTQFFPSQNQECLLEGLKRVFEHIGGVPPRLRFDNLSTAVVKVLEDGKRELTEGFSRHNAFVPVPTVAFFEAFNEWLWEWRERRPASALQVQDTHSEAVGDGSGRAAEAAGVSIPGVPLRGPCQ